MTTVRTRFAPSPTGHLHIGGARTALFNWLFARHHGGVFVLRIEDTDRERSTPEAIQAILDSMAWLGLDYDEGPYYQTQRYELYRQQALRLLDEGKAYRCYCTPAELEQKRQQAQQAGRPFGYDRTCRERTDQPVGQPFTVRFKAPLNGVTVVPDLVQGEVTFPNAELDDLIILRSDGSPTYNFCVVVDDMTMQITHVIRGNDHLSNTPKQILMYTALGYPTPQFAHIPLILGADKAKLSKRHTATAVMSYRDSGYLPEALVNYLARLGWGFGDQEIFSRAEMIAHFTLDGVGKSAGIFNPDKLIWLNQHYLKNTPPEELAVLLQPYLAQKGYAIGDPARLPQIVALYRERSRTLAEMAETLAYYFVADVQYDAAAARKFFTPAAAALLQALRPELEALEQFTVETLDHIMRDFCAARDLKFGTLAQPLRLALTGGAASPGLFEVMALLGKTVVISRIERAIHVICAEK